MKSVLKRNTYACMALLSAGLLSLAQSAQGASFECEEETLNSVEQMICANAELSELDEKMSKVYATFLEGTGNASARQSQRLWIKQRNRCTDSACIKSAYTKRIAELSSSKPPGYRMIRGEGYAICEAMYERLNEEIARKPKGPVCGYDILRSIPGVTLPNWTQLDLKKDKELYMRFLLAAYWLGNGDWEAAFSEPPPKPGEKLKFGSMPPSGALELQYSGDVAEKKNVQFHKWTNAWPSKSDTDVMLNKFTPSDETGCSVSHSRLFEANLKRPVITDVSADSNVRTWGWGDQLSGTFSFKYKDKHYLARSSNHDSKNEDFRLVTDGFSINLVSEEYRRRFWPPEICLIRNNRYLRSSTLN